MERRSGENGTNFTSHKRRVPGFFATVCSFTFCFFLSFLPVVDMISAAFSSPVYVPSREKYRHVSGKACL